MLPRSVAISAFAFCTFLSPVIAADDWPQWLGPNRDGVWKGAATLDKLPTEFKRVWTATCCSTGTC